MIEIDGSFGEGGGQILRTSLALSLLTRQPFRLYNVRAGRAKPGLQPQHLMSVRAAAAVSGAAVRGDAVGSREIFFEPGGVVPGKYCFAIGTAGATGLVLHTIYLPLAWQTSGPSEVTLEGGTHVKASPSFHFLDVTWRAWLERLDLRLNLKMSRPGFYPRGGGEVHAVIQSCTRLKPLRVTSRGPITRVAGFSAAAKLPEHVARRQARRATTRLEDRGLNVRITEEHWPGGPGSVLVLRLDEAPTPALFVGLGARGKPSEAVADEAVDEALSYLDSGAPVDIHSADQLVLPLALAEGESEYRVAAVTRHLTTNIAIVKRFLERDITCEGLEGSPGVVRVVGRKV